jgi:uncharacterized protein (TIGR02145 family)
MHYKTHFHQNLKLLVVPVLLFWSSSCSSEDEAPSNSTVKDINGNIYNTVSIGNQVWMVENLKVTKYNNGDPIANLTNAADWNNTVTTGAWSYWGNDPVANDDYGKHYNWFAVNDVRRLCPLGWHVPSNQEWTMLADNLGGEDAAGGKMKESGLKHWASPNTDATNESGFTGLPGGTVGFGAFQDLGSYGRWWASNADVVGSYAFFVWLSYDDPYLRMSSTTKEIGFCVRCLKD